MRIVKQLAGAMTAAIMAGALMAAPAAARDGSPGSVHYHEVDPEGVFQYSTASGADGTWTANKSAYDNGEFLTDSRDGPDAGVYRRRTVYQCPAGSSPSGVQTLNADDLNCMERHVVPLAHNVDGGAEPEGDWCAAGAARMICRGEGFTYAEARRSLGY